MKDTIGVTVSRVLRAEYEAGKKPPASAPYVDDLGFYYSVTQVLLPGKKNKTTLIEIKPAKLQALITSIQAEEREARAQLIDKKTRQKTRKIKNQTVLLAEKDEQIRAQTKKIKELAKILGTTTHKTDSVERELARAKHEKHEMHTQRMDALNLAHAKGKSIRDMEHEIARLKSQLADADQLNRNLEKSNQALGKWANKAGNEDPNPPIRTSSSITDGSSIKITSSKPYPNGGPFR